MALRRSDGARARRIAAPPGTWIGSEALVPGILALTGAPVFGWAKPVPVARATRNSAHGQSADLAPVISNIAFAVLLVAVVYLGP
jgi:hypothetical protein